MWKVGVRVALVEDPLLPGEVGFHSRTSTIDEGPSLMADLTARTLVNVSSWLACVCDRRLTTCTYCILSSTWTWKFPIFPQDQGTLCRRWGGLLEKPLTSLKRPSPAAATYAFFFLLFYFFFRVLFAKNLKIPLKNHWVLWFPPNHSDYRFGQLLVCGVCAFFRF